MAGRNRLLHHHHHHHRHPPPELHILEDHIVSRSRDIQTLLLDNQRLATTYVGLQQELDATDKELRQLSSAASSIKAEKDAQVREVYNRSLQLESETRSIDGIGADLNRVRDDVVELQRESNDLSDNLKDVEGDLGKTHSELQELPEMKDGIEVLRREIQRGRAAIEYERKMRANNLQLSEAMEKNIISLARETEKLRSELANAEKRAMEAAAAAASAAPAGPGYGTQCINIEPGYCEHLLSDPYTVHQVHVDAIPHYGLGVGRHGRPGPYNIQ